MKIDQDNIPAHVAIIMDGNGRWAKARKLPVALGHRQGAKAVETVMRAARDLNVKILTLYAFSTENWSRPRSEIDALMRLLDDTLVRKTEQLKKEGVSLRTIGDISALPPNVRKKLKAAEDVTGANTDFILNLALNYGGRREIVDAVRGIARDIAGKVLRADDITEEVFSRYLYTKDLPDPDLLIRTSGEMRISNFLLWQLSYTELYVTPTLWPDFSEDDFKLAVLEYQKRVRRYGSR
ncbi:MAG: isoprenyl transferase [Candidatus Omnitrophica bacterium]|nr:isoprenyl transferase [Candidatus Omnitrophota bacterium]